MPALYTNQATSTLASAISSTDTSLTVQTNHGTRFPTLGVFDHFFATLDNGSGTVEIVKVTSRLGDTFTIERAQDGTSAAGFSAGTTVEIRITRALLDAVKTDANPLNFSKVSFYNYATELLVTGIPNWATEVNILLDNVARTATSLPYMQLGTSSGLDGQSQSYWQMWRRTVSNNHFAIGQARGEISIGADIPGSSGGLLKSHITLSLLSRDDNAWAFQCRTFWVAGSNAAYDTSHVTGYKKLGSALDRFRIWPSSGSFGQSGFAYITYR